MADKSDKKIWKFKAFILLLLILILIPITHAEEYSFLSFNISITLDRNGNMHEEVSFLIKNLGDEKISAIEYFLIKKPLEFSAYDNLGKLDYTFESDNHVIIDLRKPLLPGKKTRIRMEYILSDIVADYENSKILTFSYIPDVSIKNFSIRVILPEGSMLASETKREGESISTAYPTPERIYTDGERIIIEWSKKNLVAHENFRIFVMYKMLEEKKIKYALLIFIGIILGSGVTFLAFKGRGKKKEMKIAKLVLSEDEQKIFDLLVERRGIMLQEEITKELGYSKAKVSKLVRKLEEKGIIRKEPYKKTNKLYLKKEFGGEY